MSHKCESGNEGKRSILYTVRSWGMRQTVKPHQFLLLLFIFLSVFVMHSYSSPDTQLYNHFFSRLPLLSTHTETPWGRIFGSFQRTHKHTDTCTSGLQRGYLWSITHRGIPSSDTNQNNRRLYLISFNICTRKMCKYVNSFVQWCIKLQKKRENKWSPAGKEVRSRAAWKHNRTIYMFKTTRKALFLHPAHRAPWQSERELFINTYSKHTPAGQSHLAESWYPTQSTKETHLCTLAIL